MTAYIVRRVLWLAPVLFAVAVVTFIVMHSVPGGPWDHGRPIPPDLRERLNHTYGLDQPVWEQFGKYLLNLAHGDLGISLRQRNRPVSDILADTIPVSAILGLLALAVSVAAGITLGVAAAVRRNGPVDYLCVAFTTLGGSIPSFLLGMILLIVFTAELHWLPSGGWGSPKQAVMPVLALSAWPAAYIARVTRAAMLEVLDQPYVQAARARGLHETVVVLRHALRNALIPVLTVIGPVAAVLVTGTFLVEQVFGIPGMGRVFVNSIGERDYGVIMGATLFYTLIVALANLAVDVLYAAIDPRIRYEAQG